MTAPADDPGYTYDDPYEGTLFVDRRAELEEQMPTYRVAQHPLYTAPAQDAVGRDDFQQAARAAHRAAGDYGRHVAQTGSVY